MTSGRAARRAADRDSSATGRAAAALARFYDLDLERDDPGDTELYLALAERASGPVVELAAGTGRLAVPLATAGHEVTAVDLDPAMLERARSRAEAAAVGDRVHFVEADLLDLESQPLPLAGTVGLVILALNSLFLLPSPSDQAAALRVMAAHLAPGGIAVVDVWLPSASDLAGYDDRLLLAAVHEDPEAGELVTKTWSATHDAATQRVVLTTIYEAGRPGEPVVRWVRRDAMRLVGADELRGLAEAAGLVVETVAGSYDLGPLGPGAERAILVAVRP